jgi:hypothetical protein
LRSFFNDRSTAEKGSERVRNTATEVKLDIYTCAYEEVLFWVDVLFSESEFLTVRRLCVIHGDCMHIALIGELLYASW